MAVRRFRSGTALELGHIVEPVDGSFTFALALHVSLGDSTLVKCATLEVFEATSWD